MTREEALAKIEELKNYIQELDEPVGYKDDTLFLLSKEEYEKYQDKIPHIGTWWWLRSSGHHSFLGANVDYDGFDSLFAANVDYDGFDSLFAANVDYDGFVDEYGTYVSHDEAAVRPAFKSSIFCAEIGKRYLYKSFPFIAIDKHLFIAEVPIAFNKFDDESNDYETSEIRQFLKNWEKNR